MMIMIPSKFNSHCDRDEVDNVDTAINNSNTSENLSNNKIHAHCSKYNQSMIRALSHHCTTYTPELDLAAYIFTNPVPALLSRLFA